MNGPSRNSRIRPTLLAGALALAFCAPAWSQDDDVLRLVRPESSVAIGAGWLTRDAPRFGLYNGLDERGAYLLLDADVVRRHAPTGTWYRLVARNLGLDTRELRAEYDRQGNLAAFVEYNQMVRRDPHTVFTALQGIGGNTLAVSTTGLRDVKLEMERRIVRLGVEKAFGPWSAGLVFRNEDKEGARIFGRGTPNAMEFLADPVSYTTRQLDASVGYSGERLQLLGGFYGTSFDNEWTALNISGGNSGLAGGAAPFTPIALPPDSDSRQWHLAGGYNFTRGTRLSFKVAKGRATQDDAFILAPATIVARDNLGGRLDTTLAQAGLTTRLAPAFSLNAQVRYEERDDRTPLAQYFTGVTATGTSNGFNEPRSQETRYGKVEALWHVGAGWRVAGRYEYDERVRNTSPVRVVSHRDTTEEDILTLEVRRSMGEWVTGSIAVQRAERDGSAFNLTVLNNGAAGSNLVAPLVLADRERDKVRAAFDLSPTDAIGVQLVGEESRDDYGGRDLGPRRGRQRHVALDGSFNPAEDWRVNAWYGFDQSIAEQNSQVSAPTGQLWRVRLETRGKAFGAGVKGRIAARFDVGVDVQHHDNRAVYDQRALTGAALPVIPDVTYRQTTLTAFARMPLGKDAGIRVLYIHDRWSADDWTWANFTFVDGTRVLSQPSQRAHFVGVAYTLAFR